MTSIQRIITIVPLRPYQTAALIDDAACRLRGARVVCLVAPTGAGKSRMAAAWAQQQQGRGMWIAHRQELLAQAAATMAPEVPCSYRMVQSNARWEPADWYVCDEAHHLVGTPDWSKRGALTRNGPTLLLTATPERGDGAALGNLADALVVAAQPRQLIADGFLVPCDVIAPAAPTRSMSEHPVTAWRKHADGKTTIVFCRDTAHARLVADQFRDAGVPAGDVEGRMDPELRAARLAAFESGELKVLTNTHLLTEGWDSPSTECAILCAGISTPGAWLQRIGRIVRASPGKTRATVIDLRGSVYLYGLPDEPRSYSLEGKAITIGGDTSEAIRQCPACFRVFLAKEYADATCPNCGARSKGRPDPKVRRETMQRVLAAHSQDDKARKLAELWRIAAARKYKPGWVFARFRLMYGHFPPPRSR